jgi:PadR family transcriptional regulator PadR
MRIAVAMMNEPFGRHYGYGLSTTAHVASGVMYPILDRMLADGWVTDYWETPDEITAKRPRRYYVLTNKGRTELGSIERQAVTDPRLAHLFRAAGP